MDLYLITALNVCLIEVIAAIVWFAYVFEWHL